MTTEAIIQLVTALGVVPALFIWLFMIVTREFKADRAASRHREERLMTHLERTNENQEKIANTLEKLESRIEKVEQRLDHHLATK